MAGFDLARKQIRDNVKTLLLSNTNAGVSVFTSRINKAFIEELPGIFIYTPVDTPILNRKMEQNFDRICSLRIECVIAEISESQTIQDEADILAGQVEDLLLPNIYLQSPAPWETTPGERIVNYINLTDSIQDPLDDTLEDLYVVSLDFSVGYYYCKNTLANIDDFDRFQHDIKTGDQIMPSLTEITP